MTEPPAPSSQAAGGSAAPSRGMRDPARRRVYFSDSPSETLWWHLGRYRDEDTVTAEICRVHQLDKDSEQDARKQAKHIRYCVEQASEYYRAAAGASLATKPLPLYYGMSALAWAVILFRQSGDYALDNLALVHRGHGLERPILDYADRRLPLADLLGRIRTRIPDVVDAPRGSGSELRGTFGLFYKSVEPEVGYVDMVTSRPGGVTSTSTAPAPPERKPEMATLAGLTLSLKDLLFQIPDMAFVLSDFGIRTPFVYCSQCTIRQGPPLDPGDMHLTVATSRATPEEVARLRAKFRAVEGAIFDDAPGGFTYRVVLREAAEDVELPALLETADGRRLFYAGEDGLLPEGSVFLAVAFILGMLVRYFPHIWMHWLEKRHAVVDLVDAVVRLGEVEFPRMVLNALTGYQNVFRPAQ